jgi:ribosomal protein L11 methyltransferase
MLAFVVSVRPDDVEVVSDALWSLGVVAVEERSTVDGGVELWTSLGDVDPATIEWPQQWPWRLVEIDESVADTWREFAEPIVIEPDLVVRPAWVPYEAPVGVTVVHIEPGATFGMGDHPTTILSLRALRRLVTPGCTVLDVGCGSGVLAIGACLFGAAAAVGVDIAPAAVPVTEANALANGVADRMTVSTTDLQDVPGVHDVVVANILAPTLIALAPDLRRVVAPGGALVISGILASAHAHVLAALAPLHAVATDEMDGWVAVTLR